jgi:BlaI family penicillinase repressor
MKKGDIELFESEWTILEAVWELEPCAAPTVQESLSGTKDWAYSTVKTMMDRMVKKGLLEADKICNLYLYRSAITKRQAQSTEIVRTLKRAFDGAMTPMMQFMINNDDLSNDEYDQLEMMIKERKAEKSCLKSK